MQKKNTFRQGVTGRVMAIGRTATKKKKRQSFANVVLSVIMAVLYILVLVPERKGALLEDRRCFC